MIFSCFGIREKILKARAVSRETLLNHESNPRVEDRLVLNPSYHPLLRDFQKVLNQAQILLTYNKKHRTVFGEKLPITGWRKTCSLNDYLVSAKITTKDTKKSKSALSNGKFSQVCQYSEETCEFKDADWNKYHTRKGVINCNTDLTVYNFHCILVLNNT